MIKSGEWSDFYRKLQSHRKRNIAFVLLILFSLFYFWDTCLRASGKYFWYDELFTLYICRLPTFSATWQAVLHGADFNPPLLYAFTRISNAIFGEGPIGTRVPEMIGFWVFSLCLFRYVSRRFGLLAGFAAMLFPLVTTAYSYAYEARPHAIVLGFCGLAIVFWQMMQEQPQKKRWLFAFSLSLAGAFLSHCYAVLLLVPFVIAEAYSTVRLKYLRWRRWAAMAVPLLASAVFLVPLLQSYRIVVASTSFAHLTRARWNQFPKFYVTLLAPSFLTEMAKWHQSPKIYLALLSPAFLIAAICVVLGTLFAVNRGGWGLEQKPGSSDFALALGFLALPLFGVMLAKIIQGPFIPRYFLSAVIGLCLFLGFAVRNDRSKWVGSALALVLVLSVGRSFAQPMTTRPGGPLNGHRLLGTQEALQPLPIVVPNAFEFMYLTYYDPALNPRLYYVLDQSHDTAYWQLESSADTYFREIHLLRELCHLDFNREETVSEFIKSNPKFLVYGYTENRLEASTYEIKGAVMKSLKSADGHFLAGMQMKSGN